MLTNTPIIVFKSIHHRLVDIVDVGIQGCDGLLAYLSEQDFTVVLAGSTDCFSWPLVADEVDSLASELDLGLFLYETVNNFIKIKATKRAFAAGFEFYLPSVTTVNTGLWAPLRSSISPLSLIW